MSHSRTSSLEVSTGAVLSEGLALAPHDVVANHVCAGSECRNTEFTSAEASSFSNEFVIEPSRGWIRIEFKELWRQRELLYFLIWRDVKVRYKQTVLGMAWAILVPVLSMIVFTVIFGKFAGFQKLLPAELAGAYPVYTYAGLLPWLFFSNAITQGGLSLVNQQHLLTKIYFPRLFVPTANVGGMLVDCLLSFFVFVGLMLWYGLVPHVSMLLLPLLFVETLLASLGIAYLLSALTVSYRDFRFVIPFMVQAWQFLSPVVYPSSIIPERYRVLFALNPMAGIIDGFRSATLGVPASWSVIGVSCLSTALLFVFGAMYFRKTERRFADIA
jgi:lipopolysaccharide transport system permease protein